MNTAKFLEHPQRYFDCSYQQFVNFGGPCVYFHQECLNAGAKAFLSDRHLETLYATLTAWGMHRMGEGSTKLVAWDVFSRSIREQRSLLEPLRALRMVDIGDDAYLAALGRLRPAYSAMRVSVSEASVVGNSKTLFHLLPELIPPIDRQYTLRFFWDLPDRWLNAKGKFRAIQINGSPERQFGTFQEMCLRVKRLADRAGLPIIEAERQKHGVTPPKALDNAIVNYVRLTARRHALTEPADL